MSSFERWSHGTGSRGSLRHIERNGVGGSAKLIANVATPLGQLLRQLVEPRHGIQCDAEHVQSLEVEPHPHAHDHLTVMAIRAEPLVTDGSAQTI